MAASPDSRRGDSAVEPAVPTFSVGAYESSPGRLVFIEDGNTDAWIATDHVVAPRE